jgi:hypothetical protein
LQNAFSIEEDKLYVSIFSERKIEWYLNMVIGLYLIN